VAGAGAASRGSRAAGQDVAPGRGPTREQMAEIRDGAVREIVVGMHDATLLSPGGAPPDCEC